MGVSRTFPYLIRHDILYQKINIILKSGLCLIFNSVLGGNLKTMKHLSDYWKSAEYLLIILFSMVTTNEYVRFLVGFLCISSIEVYIKLSLSVVYEILYPCWQSFQKIKFLVKTFYSYEKKQRN